MKAHHTLSKIKVDLLGPCVYHVVRLFIFYLNASLNKSPISQPSCSLEDSLKAREGMRAGSRIDDGDISGILINIRSFMNLFRIDISDINGL